MHSIYSTIFQVFCTLFIHFTGYHKKNETDLAVGLARGHDHAVPAASDVHVLDVVRPGARLFQTFVTLTK